MSFFQHLIEDAVTKLETVIIQAIENLLTKAGPHGTIPVADVQKTLDAVKASFQTPPPGVTIPGTHPGGTPGAHQ